MLLTILGYVRLIPIVIRGVLCCVPQQMLSYSLKSLRTLSFYYYLFLIRPHQQV